MPHSSPNMNKDSLCLAWSLGRLQFHWQSTLKSICFHFLKLTYKVRFSHTHFTLDDYSQTHTQSSSHSFLSLPYPVTPNIASSAYSVGISISKTLSPQVQGSSLVS